MTAEYLTQKDLKDTNSIFNILQKTLKEINNTISQINELNEALKARVGSMKENDKISITELEANYIDKMNDLYDTLLIN